MAGSSDTLKDKQTQLYSKIFYSIPDAALIADDNGKYVEVNVSARSLLGYTKKELLTMSVWDIMPEKNITSGKEMWQAFIQKGRIQGEYKIRRKNGEIRTVIFKTAANIAPNRHCSFLTDVSREKSVEMSLKQCEQNLTNISDGFFFLDNEMRFTYCNRAAEKILGRKQQEVLGKHIFKHVFPEAKGSVFEEQYNRANQNKIKASFETFFGTSTHEDWYEVSVFPSEDGISVNFKIITERKNIENELLKSEQLLRQQELIDAQNASLNLIEDLTNEIENRKKAEADLKKSEERFELAVNGSNDGIWDWEDLNSDELWWSDRMYEILGYKPGEVKATLSNWRKWTHPDDRDYVLKILNQHLKDKEAYNVEFRMKKKSGEYIWLSVRGANVLDENGHAIRMSGSTADITERKQMAEALRDSEERYRTLFENADVLVSVYDVDGKCLLMNKKLAGLFKYESQNFIGKSMRTLHPDLGDVYTERIQSAIKTGKTGEYEDLVKFPTGSRWLLSRVHPVVEADGECKSAQIISHDITERKHAELELKEQTAFLDQIIESAAISTWISDDKGTAIRTNPACLEFFGATAEEVVGKYNIFKDSVVQKQGFLPEIKRVFEKGEVASIIIDYDFAAVDHVDIKYPTHKIINSILTPVLDSRGKVTNVIVQAIDLTDIKNAEQELRFEKERAQKYLDTAGVMLIALNKEYKVTLINPAGCEILGVTQKEIIGVDWFENFLPSEDRATVKELFAAIISGDVESTEYYEQAILRKDGQARIIAWHNSIFRDNAGNIIGTLSSGEDVTERRNAEQQVRRLRDFYGLVLQNIHDGIWVTDANDCIVFFNVGVEKIAGAKARDMIGKNVIKDFPSQTTDAFLEFYHKAKLQKKPYPYEVGVITPAGGKTIQSGWLVPRFEDGKYQGIICTIQDITERKQAEERLRESERKMTTLLGNLPGIAYRCLNVTNWTMEYISDGCRSLTGYEPEDLIGDKVIAFADLIHPDDRQMAWDVVQQADQEGGHFENEYRIIDKDNNERWVWERGQFLPGMKGKIKVLEGFITDITEHKKAEIALAKSERTFRSIMESSPIAIYIYELDDKDNLIFSGYNKAANRTVGVDNSQFIGMSIEQAFPPLADTNLPDAFYQAAKFGRPFYVEQVEYNFGGIDGIYETYAFQMSPGRVAIMFNDITEKKRAEDRVRQSEERLRQIIESMPVMMDAFDENFNVVAWNKECERITGYSSEQVLGLSMPFEKLYPDPEYLKKIMADYDNSGSHFRNKEYTLVTKDGTRKTISWSNISKEYPVPGWHSWAVGVDVTKRKQVEEELRQSQQELQLLIENSVDVVWKMDLRLNFTFASPSIFQMCGYTREEWVGTNLAEHATRKEFFKMARKAIDAIKNFHSFDYFICESELLKKNGESIPVEIIGKLLLNEKGLPVGLQGTTRDVTERKIVEETKRKLADRITAVMQTGNLAWWEMEYPSDVFTYDQSLARILGYSSHYFHTFQDYLDIIHPDDIQKTKSALQKHAEGSIEKYQAEFRIRAKDGNWRWFRGIGRITDPDKLPAKSYRMVGIIEDITPRKELEEQLFQSQKMDAIGTLAGGIAHDFNNLLTIINGYSELLADKEYQDASLNDALENISIAGNKAASLTRQLLAFSRTSIIQPTLININSVIREMHKMLLRMVGENIKFDLHLHDQELVIKTDKGQFEQVILNMVVNARDAMPSGGKLDIHTDIVNLKKSMKNAFFDIDAGRYAEITIQDTGIGMSSEMQNRIFEPFFTSKKTGTGLGLSTVFGIIKRSEGLISVKSEQGRGSTFRILLPLLKKLADPVGTEEEILQSGSESILVVDDEKEIVTFLKQVLENYGYTVHIACNAEDAIQNYTDKVDEFDLLITDVIMTERDGTALVDHFMSLKPDLKYFFISGYADVSDVQYNDLIKQGLILQKPFRKGKLLKQVRDVLKSLSI